ncbi:hypothetical protein RvY_18372 [Ramazzottius varieornatus]|uniref:Uncharacterized protein n=1 Tax=Ramazzottius varieornatus TaxID=947166 RepID=A0A1D1W8S8_RAMVA|nr:hypothetical protein RvY_18372 [Ramazzottius varieornatus]
MALKKGNSTTSLPFPTSAVAAAVLSAGSSSTPPPAAANESKWITLVEDQDAKVFTFGSCMALTDLRGEGRWALIAGELSQSSGEVRLRALDGQTWRDAFKLPEFPSAVLTLNLEPADTARRVIPAIAVAVGNMVLLYKSMKPLCRYQLPPVSPLEEEADLWLNAKEKNIGVVDLVNRLTSLLEAHPSSALSQRSRALLMLPHEEREGFLQEHVDKPLYRSTSITCMTTVNNKLKDESSDQLLVVGTENRQVLIVDALSNTTKAQHDMPDVPVTVATHGTFQERYRLFVSCRDGKIYTVTKDYSEIVSVSPNDRPITVLSTGKYLVVPCMDETVYFYKGKNNELQHKLSAAIACAEVIKYEASGLRAVAIALANKEVYVFKDDQLVDVSTYDDVVIAMKYGRFDREEGAMAFVLRNGTVLIRLIRRRAKFDPVVQERIFRPLESVLPKKSKMFFEQTAREKENPKRTNTAIFDNLSRMKYEINKRYAESMHVQAGSGSVKNDIIITPQLLGSGPWFKLTVIVQNTSSTTPLVGYGIFIEVDRNMYDMKQTIVELPFVVPQGKFVFARSFRFVGQQTKQGSITIHLLRNSKSMPVLCVQAVIPESDVSLE